MENQIVWNLILRWLFDCYEPPYVHPPPVQGADFDPLDYGRRQYDDLVEALRPPPRRPPPRPPSPPFVWPGTEHLTLEQLEALLEDP